jgi:hypothetical protein
MSNTNYNGRVGNNTSNTRYFTPGIPDNLWITSTYSSQTVLTPSSSTYKNVYIPGNLYVDGTINNPSDLVLKDNISTITTDLSDTIMKLKPSQFTFKSDNSKQVHYGFIAQELEEHLPELVTIKPCAIINPIISPTSNPLNKQDIKAINYLEILPLLVHKVQSMQLEIDELKSIINNTHTDKSKNV